MAGAAKAQGPADRAAPWLTVREVVDAWGAGRLSAERYLGDLLAWQARWRALNAFTVVDADGALAAARRLDRGPRGGLPLGGLVFAAKDNIDVVGFPTTAGTPALRQNMPRTTAPMVQGVLDRGGVVLGKLGMHEMAIGGTGANIAFGQIRNPYDLRMVPGGSSSGTAAAVAAGLIPAGLGTDTAGSVRLPAAHCGCVGFRPSMGRYDRTGVIPGAAIRDTIGWLARNCADIELLDRYSGVPAAPAGAVSLRGLRIGVPRRFFYDEMHPDVAAQMDSALGRLSDAGAVLVEAELPEVGPLMGRLSQVMTAFDFEPDLQEYLTYAGSSLTPAAVVEGVADPILRRILQGAVNGPKPDPARYRDAVDVALPALKAAYARYFAEHRLTAFAIPTTPAPPFPAPARPEEGGTGPWSMVRNTEPTAFVGAPGLSVPTGLTPAGLPVGLEFVGPVGSDATVLKLGQAFEAITAPLPRPPLPA